VSAGASPPLAHVLGLVGQAHQDSTPRLRADPVEVVAADLGRFVPSRLKRHRIPGLAIALIRKGRVALAGGYGIRK
jgi:hypothetical protein